MRDDVFVRGDKRPNATAGGRKLFQVVLQECYEEARSFWEERGHRSRLAGLEFARRLFAPSERCCHATSQTTYVPRRLNGAVQGCMTILYPSMVLTDVPPSPQTGNWWFICARQAHCRTAGRCQTLVPPLPPLDSCVLKRSTPPATTRGGV